MIYFIICTSACVCLIGSDCNPSHCSSFLILVPAVPAHFSPPTQSFPIEFSPNLSKRATAQRILGEGRAVEEGQRQDNGTLFPMCAKLRWTPLLSVLGSSRSQQSARASVRLIKRGSLQGEHWPHIRGPTVVAVLLRKLGTWSWGRTNQGTEVPAALPSPTPSSCPLSVSSSLWLQTKGPQYLGAGETL